jgi:ABC-type transporter Mla maintaining outer membrane lipid asymmetry ATPase subunit MlaF
MSDAAELKKLVKQLQNTSTDEVCVITHDVYVAFRSISDQPILFRKPSVSSKF